MRPHLVNAFSIHNIKTNKPKYVYHEEEANMSPDEMGSFLFHYIHNFVPSATKNHLRFSDEAAGQNKNGTLVRFLMNPYDREQFKSITQYFPVHGHSFLPCHRDFVSIKRLLRRTDTPQKYIQPS